MNFQFATANKIIFGAGSIQNLASLSNEFGKHAFVVTGTSSHRADVALGLMKKAGIGFEIFHVFGEPTTHSALQAVNHARTAKCDFVIGIGGGSVIDTGKVVAALLTNRGELLDYLEVVGQGKKLQSPAGPYIAIPTTAGTGAEVTKNSVLASPQHRVKVSMRSDFMLPRLALIDPELTYSLPPEITASTGLDAFTQLLEVFVSTKANPLTDGICREGLKRAGRALPLVYENGTDKSAREDMSIASLFGGLALANAKLGAVHGFAGPLGGWLDAPHGVICARLLPLVTEANLTAVRNRKADHLVVDRFKEIAQILTNRASAKPEAATDWIYNLCEKLKVPPLATFGLKVEDFPDLIEKSKNASSMKGNPVELTDDALKGILVKAL